MTVIRIETRCQYVAKASVMLDRFGSPFWGGPDDPIRSARTSRSIARISRINRIDLANGTRPMTVITRTLSDGGVQNVYICQIIRIFEGHIIELHQAKRGLMVIF